MFISFLRAAEALLFVPNSVLRAAAPAPIVCISVRRETVSIARPSVAPDLRRPTDIATLYHADFDAARVSPQDRSGPTVREYPGRDIRLVRHQMSEWCE